MAMLVAEQALKWKRNMSRKRKINKTTGRNFLQKNVRLRPGIKYLQKFLNLKKNLVFLGLMFLNETTF